MFFNPKERLLIENGFKPARFHGGEQVIYYTCSKMPGGNFEDYVGKSEGNFRRRIASHMKKPWGPYIKEIWVKELENDAINIFWEEQKYIKILNPSINCKPGETRKEVEYRIIYGNKNAA